MNTETTTASEPAIEILENVRRSGSDGTQILQGLVDYYREQQLPMELFETRKLLIRDRLGLPLVASDDQPLRSEELERQLESGLLEACRESGEMLIRQERILEGYTYLRPLGDNGLLRSLLSEVPITQDNCDEMQRVLLHEGVDVARGYQSVLDFQGTCNSITIYDQFVSQRGKADRQAAANCLLDHFYRELTSLVREDIMHRGKSPSDKSVSKDDSLFELLEGRPWVLKEGGYHLDTTHLSAAVRIASVLTDPKQLRKAWELTQYGRQLHHQFQYPGDEPFVDFYPAYAAFYGILLGENVEAGLKLFQRKAVSVDTYQYGTGALETYIDLLDRVGRPIEAIEFAVSHAPEDVPAATLVPQLLEIAVRGRVAGDDSGFERIMDFCIDRKDLISLAIAKHESITSQS